ncbi:MAG: T9SS type A sorting domain-containing protein [Cyclobacteriaceae bacterium]
MKYFTRSTMLLLVLCTVGLPSFSQADITAVQNGNWSTASTWGGSTPGNGDIIYIPSGISVTIPNGQDVTLTDAVLVVGGSLALDNSGLNYSTLTLDSSDPIGNPIAGVVMEEGGEIVDDTWFGWANFIEVDGETFWGGRNSTLNPAPLYQGTQTFNAETSQPTDIQNPLPVDLVKFIIESDEEKVQLKWITASELNNEGFEIQKSLDGENFDEIGFVDGHGTTTDVHTYTFADHDLADAYYRLKQIDFDGKYEYSPIRYLRHDKSLIQKFEIYPNPTSGAIHIKGALTNYALFDEMGRLLLENQNTTTPAAQTEISDYLIANNDRGTFFMKSIMNGKMKVTRILKE